MYDTSIGQWLSEDPIGFAAGDANPRRYVGNSPTNATDPWGLQIKPKNEAPITSMFFDELMYYLVYRRTMQKEADIIRELKNPLNMTKDQAEIMMAERAIRRLVEWRTLKSEYFELNVYYVDSIGNEFAFAKDAFDKGPGTINLYVGHGGGQREEDVKVGTDSLKGRFTKPPWKADKYKDKLKDLGEPLFAYTCCFGGSYNSVVPKEILVPGSMTEGRDVGFREVLIKLGRLTDEIDTIISQRIKARKR